MDILRIDLDLSRETISNAVALHHEAIHGRVVAELEKQLSDEYMGERIANAVSKSLDTMLDDLVTDRDLRFMLRGIVTERLAYALLEQTDE